MLLVWPTFYGLLTAVVFALAYHARRRVGDILTAAVLLCVSWANTNVCEFLHIHPRNTLYPLMDCGFAALMAWMWRHCQARWKYLLIVLVIWDEVLDVTFFLSPDHSYRARYAYDLKTNLVYLCQLATVGYAALRKAKVDVSATTQRIRSGARIG